MIQANLEKSLEISFVMASNKINLTFNCVILEIYDNYRERESILKNFTFCGLS